MAYCRFVRELLFLQLILLVDWISFHLELATIRIRLVQETFLVVPETFLVVPEPFLAVPKTFLVVPETCLAVPETFLILIVIFDPNCCLVLLN